MMKYLTNIVYMLGMLIAFMFIIGRSKMPSIILEYQIPILILTILAVLGVLVYNKGGLKR